MDHEKRWNKPVTHNHTHEQQPTAVESTHHFTLEAINPRKHDLDSDSDTSTGTQRSTCRTTFILIALYLSLFLTALDGTIVATAVPAMSHDLGSATGYIWIGGAYLLANATTTPIWGKLSDIWGRKLIILAAISIFFISSTICATAATMQILVAGRALQGVAGGGLTLLVHVAISDLFSVRQRSLFMGLTEAVWAVAGGMYTSWSSHNVHTILTVLGIGPVIGGVFTSLVSWRWCFYINLPICAIAFILVLFSLDIEHEHTSLWTGLCAIDWCGIVAFLACALPILLGLTFGGSLYAWTDARVLCLILVGVVMIGPFIYSEAKIARYPIMPLKLFRDKSNLAALGVGFFHGVAFVPAEYYIPLYYQAVKQQSPLCSGILFTPFVVISAVVGIVTGVIMHKTGRHRELNWVGASLLTLGMGLFILLDGESSTGKVIGLTVLFGCGSGLLFEPPLIAIQNRSAQQDVATATSTFTFVRSMAMAISVIIGGVVFQNSMDIQSRRLQQAGLSPNIAAKLTGHEAASHVALGSQIPDLESRRLIQSAFAWSMRNMWIMYTVFAGLTLLCSLFVSKAVLSKDHTETVTGIRKEKKTTRDVESA